MKCSIADMRNKEVIKLQDGTRLGFVGDVEIDTENAKLTTIITVSYTHLAKISLFQIYGVVF